MIVPFQKVILSLCLILPLLWPDKKKIETYYIWLPVHVFLKDPPYQLSSQVPTKHSSVTNIPGARHYIKVTFFLFSLGRSQKKCVRRIVFSPDKIYSMSSMEGSLVFSVPSKDSSKIPYFPDFIMRSGCFPLYLLWGLLYLHWMPNQTPFPWHTGMHTGIIFEPNSFKHFWYSMSLW